MASAASPPCLEGASGAVASGQQVQRLHVRRLQHQFIPRRGQGLRQQGQAARLAVRAGLPAPLRLGLGQPAKRRPVQADKKPANEWAFVFSLPVETQALAKKIYRCAQKIGALQEPKVRIMPKAWVEGIIAQSKGYKLNGQVCKVVAPLETCGPVHMHVLIQILESWAKKLEEAKHA